MFDADFLANIIVWRWINRFCANVLIFVAFTVAWVVYEARYGNFIPFLLVSVIFGSIGLLIWNAFRRQRRLQEWREAPIDMGRQEPYLGNRPSLQGGGLRVSPAARWPVR